MQLLKIFGLGRSTRTQTPLASVKSVTVDDAHRQRMNGDLTIIDVRKPEEWNEAGRPQGSHGVTVQDPEFLAKVEAIVDGDKFAPLALSCRSGARASRAANMLAGAGHQELFNVEGGFLAWQEAGLPVDTGPF